MTKADELNSDQKKIILALAEPAEFFRGFHSIEGIRGVPWKKLKNKTQLTLEKTLLSIGWLEAKGLIAHDMAIVRKTLDYLGQTSVEIAGQSVLRMFYLTEEGKKILKELTKGKI